MDTDKTQPAGPYTPTVGDKLRAQAEHTRCVGALVETFGPDEAVKMLRAAARMIAPRVKAAK